MEENPHTGTRLLVTLFMLLHITTSMSPCPDFLKLAKVRPTHFLVAYNDGGLADRLINAVSTFYIALATRRVLCIRPPKSSKQPRLETAYDAVYSNWTCPSSALIDSSHEWRWRGILKNPTSKAGRFVYGSDWKSVLQSNLTVLRIWMQIGITVGMFINPFSGVTARELGLLPETAFGCAFHHLFRPNMGALRLAADIAPFNNPRSLDDPKKIVIGIQIRLGDAVIKKRKHNFTRMELDWNLSIQPFFSCASELESSIQSVVNLDVSWFLISDSEQVKHTAKVKYGEKIFVFPSEIEHYQNMTAFGFTTTVVEHWLFSKAVFHIISLRSGFGRTAAFASLRTGSLFTINVGIQSVRWKNRTCLVDDSDRPWEVSTHWSGI